MADNFTTFYKNWQTRVTSARQMGLPPSAYAELLRRDYVNVQQGGTPLNNSEARDALLSQLLGHSVVGDPSRSTSGTVSPISTPSNFLKDVGNIIWHLPGGLAHLVAHAPSEITDTVKSLTGDPAAQKKLGWEPHHGSTLSILAEAMRNVAKTPLPALLPGVADAAALTTSAGRKQLERHPAGALVDVLPLVGKLGEAGALGRLAEEGSATEALQLGHPVKALYRTLPETARAQVTQTALTLGVHPQIIDLISRPQKILTRTGQDALDRIFTDRIQPLASLPPEERARLADLAAHYTSPTDPSTSPPDHAIIQSVSQLNELHRQLLGPDRLPTVLTPSGYEATYSADSPVVAKYNRANSRAEYAQQTLDRLNTHKSKVATLQAELESKGQKVRRFGESDESFTRRRADPVSIQSLRNSAQDLIGPFRDSRIPERFPEIINAVADGRIDKVTYRAFARDLLNLQGEKGLFAQLDTALSRQDVKSASSALTQIKRLMRHGAWANFPEITSYIDTMREGLLGLKSATRAERFAARKLFTAQRDLADLQSSYDAASRRAMQAQFSYYNELRKSPPANFQPMIEEQLRQGAIAKAQSLYQGTQLKSVLDDLTHSPFFSTFRTALGDQWMPLYRDIVSSWLDLAQQGFNPIWMEKVSPDVYESIGRVRVLSDHEFHTAAGHNRVLNFSPGVHDIAAGITKAMADVISEKSTHEYITRFVEPLSKPAGSLEPSYRRLASDSTSTSPLSPADSIPARAQRLMNGEWVKFDPAKYGISHSPASTAEDTLIPRWVDNALSSMTKSNRIKPIGAYDKLMRVYKFSVLTSPRHVAHVFFGGMVMATADTPSMFLQLKPAWDIIRSGSLPPELRGTLLDMPTDGVYQFKVGQTLARHAVEAVGNKLDAFRHFEDNITHMYQAATLLAKEHAGLNRDAALAETLRVFVDRDALLPIERSISKFIFPFYAFTRHILQYVFTYPVDHPIRAAILTRLAEQHYADWNSGIPDRYAETLFLGSPDSKGNVSSVDLKTLNPFRSLASAFTLAGFTSALNPTISAPFELGGFNTLAGSGDLFPQLTYNPQTGTLVAKNPVGSRIGAMVKSFIPEETLFEMFVAQTDQMKRLKQSNPSGYRALLFSSLGIPFVPERLSPAFLSEHAEIARYRAAQSAVSADTKSGNFSDSEKFSLVPYQGQYVNPAQLAAYWKLITDRLAQLGQSSISPKAVVSKKKMKIP